MKQHDIQQIRARRLLLVDWFAELACSSGYALKKSGQGDKTFFFGDAKHFHVSAHQINHHPFIDFVASDPGRQGIVDAIVREAVKRVERGDFGGIVWYSTELHDVNKLINSISFIPSFLQRLGMQQRILGWRRLGRNILLDFTEKLPSEEDPKKPLLAPKAIVHVHCAIAAPCEGYFSVHLAQYILEMVAAICTFGRNVTVPPALFTSESEILPQLTERQTDLEVGTLARKGVSLDIFSPLELPGGSELLTRMRAALLAFSAANAARA
jgi:hypothetical protein